MSEQMAKSAQFWLTVPLDQMSEVQWESLCDGCGQCCLNKLEDWDTGEIFFTNLACTLFDDQTCRCRDYTNRFKTVPDCIKLTPTTIGDYRWLPATCAYRLINEGKDLKDWHPLKSGDPDSVHAAGISVQGKTIPEDGIGPEDYEDHLVNVEDWNG